LPEGYQPPRRSRSGPSGTSPTRSPPCDAGSPWRSPKLSNDARAVPGSTTADPHITAACAAVVIMRARRTQLIAGALGYALAWPSAYAIDTMESVGAEKCGGPAKAYEIEFLAPDS